MGLRILTGILQPTERNGTATIEFGPHRVTGDAVGIELKTIGDPGNFLSPPGKILSIREFCVEDKSTFAGGSEQDWFRINDSDWTPHHLRVAWSCEVGAKIKEISYLIVGNAAV